MNVDELDLPDIVISALKERGYGELYPPQTDAIPKALEGRNLVVAVPTASGKSLIGYIAALKTVISYGKKVLYIVPLKALASEKRDELNDLAHLGFKVSLSTGDLDSEDRWMNDSDIIVATSEKADSLLRHGSQWMNDVGLVIADEIHMIHDPGRGPTLEVALTKMRIRNPNMQVIALSATISNASELAEWLDATLIRHDWRPTELREGVYFNGEIRFNKGTPIEVPSSKDEMWSLVYDPVKAGGQCLIFVNSRRSTESLAVKYSKNMSALSSVVFSDAEISILEGETESTSLGKKLSSCVKSGMAFHHAGLTYKQRKLVEEEFRKGNIKCIVATPTLAAGVNIPARRVVVRDTKRFESNAGNVPISVMEIKQMCGRAGRPRYDPYGEAILIAKNDDDRDHLMYDYVMCDSEDVISKLGNENVLRSHILGLISTGDATSEEEVVNFLKDTFYGTQSQLYGIESMVESVVQFLIDEMMIEESDGLKALPFGKRVSDLYIDPNSAVILKKAVEAMKEDTEMFPILHATASTPDVMGLFPKKGDMERLQMLADEYEGKLLIPAPDDYGEYEFFLSDLKTAELAMKWMEELDEEAITDMMGIGPGDIRSKVESMEWLLYAFCEVALIFRPDIVRTVRPLMIRIKYGVKPELSELVSLKGVGRMRARLLFDHGVKGKNDLVRMDTEKIARIPGIGNSLARSLKQQVGSSSDTSVPEDMPPADFDDEMKEQKKQQSKLFDF